MLFRSVSGAGTLLVVLGALLIGGVAGSLLRIEDRMEQFGRWLQRRLTRRPATGPDDDAAATTEAVAGDQPPSRFVEGFVDASLIFCIGPLAVLGSLSDGLGRGIDQLALKSVLDGFASLAFAASLGWGVAASAISVGVWQGLLTLLGAAMGMVMSSALIASLTATGGVLLLGVGLRLLHIRQVPVGDMLPALLVAPILTALVAHVRLG